MNLKRTVTALGAALVTVMVGASGASAQPLEHFTYHDEWTNYRDCDNGLDLRVDHVADGRVVIVEHGDGGFGYGLDVTDHTWTVTNLDTGATFQGQVKGLAWKDQTLIDNGDGTLTLLVNSPSPVTLYTPDGKVYDHGVGLAVYEFLISGDTVEFVQTVVEHGQTLGIGTCVLAEAFWFGS